MSVNTCLIYRCLSSASVVIRSWFIYEPQKSTTIAFSRNSFYTFYSRNPTCEIPPCLRISNRKYPPCPQNSIIVNPPPSPSEILKAVRGMVWIFSGIAHWMFDSVDALTADWRQVFLLVISTKQSEGNSYFTWIYTCIQLQLKFKGNKPLERRIVVDFCSS